MSEELEARIKALEEKLNPPLDKISSMKASNRLKMYLDDVKEKYGLQSQEDANWFIVEQAEKVPALEARIKELEWEIKRLKE